MNAESRRPLVALSIFVFTIFSLLIIQFFRIQIIEGEKWEGKARRQHQFIVKEPAKRGVFYSNVSVKKGHPEKEQPFVIDVAKFHLYIDPLAIPRPLHAEMIDGLSQFIPEKGLITHFQKRSRSRRLAKWVPLSEKEKIGQWWQGFAKHFHLPRNALYFTKDYHRSYPFGHLLGPVLHALREEDRPTGGLELKFNPLLKGKEGKKLLLRSPRNPMHIGEVLEKPKPGADLHLTINHYLQAICEEEIAKGVKKVGANGGWAVMMDPNTGEILALAQYPFFDPENYAKSYNDPKLTEWTKVRALSDCFEPGSTMKPISLAISLLANEEEKKRGEKPLFDPYQMVRSDNGNFPGRTRPIKDVGHHTYLNMPIALQKSSNIYIARLIQKVCQKLGDSWYRDQLVSTFGFGKPSTLELPSESTGLIPTPGKTYRSGQLEWSTPTPFSLAIGYNLLCNSLQLIRAYAIIANGGTLIEPTLIKKITQEGKDLPLPPKERRKVLPTPIANEIKSALKYSTKKGGTGWRADVHGYTEAGKTSTTEKLVKGAYSKTTHFSSFVGFAPCSIPRLVLMIGIDEPAYRNTPGLGRSYFGGICAAPVFKEIMTRSLEYLGVTPDDPHGYPPSDPRYNRHLADWNREVEKLRVMYSKYNHK